MNFKRYEFDIIDSGNDIIATWAFTALSAGHARDAANLRMRREHIDGTAVRVTEPRKTCRI